MISNKAIQELYSRFPKRPASPDELDIDLMFIHLMDNHDFYIDDDGNLVINSITSTSPFHTIPLIHIHKIVEFEDKIALVLHSSIIFLDKHDSQVHVHIRTQKPSFLDKLRYRNDD
ncbi:MAG: hypothetical protein K2O88_07575 [Paramuribaculum sp.]|nr:hypothetical protein [Paramuribaculum sp.]